MHLSPPCVFQHQNRKSPLSQSGSTEREREREMEGEGEGEREDLPPHNKLWQVIKKDPIEEAADGHHHRQTEIHARAATTARSLEFSSLSLSLSLYKLGHVAAGLENPILWILQDMFCSPLFDDGEYEIATMLCKCSMRYLRLFQRTNGLY